MCLQYNLQLWCGRRTWQWSCFGVDMHKLYWDKLVYPNKTSTIWPLVMPLSLSFEREKSGFSLWQCRYDFLGAVAFYGAHTILSCLDLFLGLSAILAALLPSTVQISIVAYVSFAGSKLEAAQLHLHVTAGARLRWSETRNYKALLYCQLYKARARADSKNQ